MALTYTFKPGGKQASEASDYFTSIATEQVEQSLGTMLPKQIMIEETRRPPLHLRVWSPRNAELQLRPMVPWLRQVIQKMCVISAPGVDPIRHMPTLLTCPESANCFIEVLGRASFTPVEQHLLTIGLRDGRTILLSTPRITLADLGDDLIGLAIHDVGSWLIEGNPMPMEQVGYPRVDHRG
ncbi:MAG: hypothetical protein WA937_01430 [Flavobacteriales bacterium]